jgi:hypothetical protein
MVKKSTNEIILSGLFIAIGVLLPVIFHLFGGGSIFLPMHIPVLISGFFLGVPYAVAVGVITPIISSILTGMPPIFPIMPYMVFELAAYGLFTSLLFNKFKFNVYFSLLGSMIIGRIIAGIAVWVLVLLFAAKLPSPIIFIYGAIIKGIPGIIIQLIFIPTIVLIVKKNRFFKAKNEVKNANE